ncbi:MAG: hypothetical protein ACYS9X_27920, partial [Planctomycetota bacterium]
MGKGGRVATRRVSKKGGGVVLDDATTDPDEPGDGQTGQVHLAVKLREVYGDDAKELGLAWTQQGRQVRPPSGTVGQTVERKAATQRESGEMRFGVNRSKQGKMYQRTQSGTYVTTDEFRARGEQPAGERAAQSPRAEADGTTAATENLFKEGVDLFEKGDYEGAREKLGAVLERDPKAAEVHKYVKAAGDKMLEKMTTESTMGREPRVLYELYRLAENRSMRRGGGGDRRQATPEEMAKNEEALFAGQRAALVERMERQRRSEVAKGQGAAVAGTQPGGMGGMGGMGTPGAGGGGVEAGGGPPVESVSRYGGRRELAKAREALRRDADLKDLEAGVRAMREHGDGSGPDVVGNVTSEIERALRVKKERLVTTESDLLKRLKRVERAGRIETGDETSGSTLGADVEAAYRYVADADEDRRSDGRSGGRDDDKDGEQSLVVLKSGMALEGRVVDESGDTVTLATEHGRIALPKSNVARLDRGVDARIRHLDKIDEQAFRHALRKDAPARGREGGDAALPATSPGRLAQDAKPDDLAEYDHWVRSTARTGEPTPDEARRKLDALVRGRGTRRGPGRESQEEAAKWLAKLGKDASEDLDYSKALRLADEALQADPENAQAKELAARTRALLGVRRDWVDEGVAQLSRERRVEVQESLIDLGKTVDAGKKLVAEADAARAAGDAAKAARLYANAAVKSKRAQEIVKWMPYQVDLSQTEAEAKETLARAREGRHDLREAELHVRSERGKVELEERLAEANIPYSETLTYPKDWKSISKRGETKDEKIARLEKDLHHSKWVAGKLQDAGVPVQDIVFGSGDTSAPPVNAKVLAVRPEVNLAMVSAGTDQGLKKGHRLTIHRGDGYVGKVEVEKVFGDMASARILSDWTKEKIKEGDGAATTGDLTARRPSPRELAARKLLSRSRAGEKAG